MAIRVAFIGYGAVGSIHAAMLRKEPDVQLVSVYGPKREKASAFASTHGIKRVCDSIGEAVSAADAAIICSPSTAHFEQARECLENGVHTLVELPPCRDAGEAEGLARIALRRGVKLGCAHTIRFVAPYVQVRRSIGLGLVGEIQDINYVHCAQLSARSWTDDALLHHAAHGIDLMFYWFGGIEAIGCVALPDVRQPQTVSVLGKLPSGGAVTITVTYALRIEKLRVMIVSDKHNIDTDGFSYANSDLEELEFRGHEQQTYHEAVHLQDVEFLRTCQGNGNFVSWDETLKVLHTVDDFRALGG